MGREARLVALLVRRFHEDSGIDVSGDETVMQRLRDQARRVLAELDAGVPAVDVNLPFLSADASGPKHLTQRITPAMLEGDLGESAAGAASGEGPVRGESGPGATSAPVGAEAAVGTQQPGARPMDGSTWASALRVPRILWGALLWSCVIYGGLIVGGVFAPAEGMVANETLTLALAVASVGVAVASFVVPATLLGQGLSRLKLETHEVLDKDAEVLFRDAAPRRLEVANPAAARAQIVPRYFTPFILSCALSEAVAIFGIVLAATGAATREVSLSFVVCGALLIALRFPTGGAIEAKVERHTKARFPKA